MLHETNRKSMTQMNSNRKCDCHELTHAGFKPRNKKISTAVRIYISSSPIIRQPLRCSTIKFSVRSEWTKWSSSLLCTQPPHQPLHFKCYIIFIFFGRDINRSVVQVENWLLKPIFGWQCNVLVYYIRCMRVCVVYKIAVRIWINCI